MLFCCIYFNLYKYPSLHHVHTEKMSSRSKSKSPAPSRGKNKSPVPSRGKSPAPRSRSKSPAPKKSPTSRSSSKKSPARGPRGSKSPGDEGKKEAVKAPPSKDSAKLTKRNVKSLEREEETGEDLGDKKVSAGWDGSAEVDQGFFYKIGLRSALGPLLLMIVPPFIPTLFLITCNQYEGNLLNLAQQLINDYTVVLAQVPHPSLFALRCIVTYFAWQVYYYYFPTLFFFYPYTS